MNLLDRIDQRLSDTRFLINPQVFEDCATSLLSPIHRGLVPIPGGSDFGLDAEITEDDRRTGLIITSSRSWDGARKSLRGSLQSMRRNKLPVCRVVVVNLTEATRSRRGKLDDIAREFECEIVQIYDRSWFANQFRENPDWRRKILDIEGGPFSFSRQPRGARPDEQQLSTVGRDALIAEVNKSNSDVTLFGVPGVGKSHVASKFDDALFLERHPSAGRLLDDLIAIKPVLVIVDDAGARLKDLDLLVQMRDAERLEYRIIATCWPHEVDSIKDHLPDTVQCEVELLSREELGAILREHGITRLTVIHNLLTQAGGRPAWALNLADLLIHESDWTSVWTGNALRSRIFAFLRMSNAPDDAVDVLGTLALFDQLDDDQVRRLSDLLKIRQPELIRLIRAVAIAGLVDVHEIRSHNHKTQQIEMIQTYSVQPSITAASVASEIYFSRAASPVRLKDVKEAFPELAAEIMQKQIYAKLLGATNPNVPTAAELIEVLPDTKKDLELLRSFGQIGPEQARDVIDIHFTRVTKALESNNVARAESEAKILAARVADAVGNKIPGAIRSFLTALKLLEDAGLDIRAVAKGIVEEVRDARSGDQPQMSQLMKLVEAIQTMPDTDLTDTAWIALASEILAPTFEGNYMSPEILNQFVLQSFTWSASQMETLYRSCETALASRAVSLKPITQIELIGLLDQWVRIARGLDLPFGGQTTPAQVQAGRRVAKDIAKILAPTITTPGVRALFNKTMSPLKIRLDEPDALFAALTQEPERQTNFQETRRRKEAALDNALEPFQSEPPEVLMEWLKTHEAELSIAGRTSTRSWQVFYRLAYQQNAEPTKWLSAAITHGLAGSAGALIDACARANQLTFIMVNRLLADPNGRNSVISSVIGQSADSQLVREVIDQLSLEDIQNLESAFILRQISESTRRALFTHPNEDVRGTAAALWAAEWTYDDEPRPQDPNWLNAMRFYTTPEQSTHDYIHTQALNALAEASSEIFTELFTKATLSSIHGRLDTLDGWKEPMRHLSFDERRTIWLTVKDTDQAPDLFWVVAAGDADWIAEIVSGPEFDISVRDLLGSMQFQFGSHFPLETLATMLRSLNPKADDLIHTLQFGSWSGEDHERHAATLQSLRDLATSEDEYLARIGQRGIEIYEPLLAEALAKARRMAVRGVRQ